MTIRPRDIPLQHICIFSYLNKYKDFSKQIIGSSGCINFNLISLKLVKQFINIISNLNLIMLYNMYCLEFRSNITLIYLYLLG